jgi:hypothetical protein
VARQRLSHARLVHTERAVLAVVARFHRDLRERGRAFSLSHEGLAWQIGLQPVRGRWTALSSLV